MLGAVTGTAEELLQAMPDGIVVVDGRGKIVFMNANATTMFGHPADEIVGRPVEVLIPPSAQNTHAHLRSGYMRNPEARRIAAREDLVARHRDGHDFPVDVSLSPWHTADRTLIIAAVRDVTERRRTEEGLRAGHEAERLKDALVSTVTHELRTPLSVIRGFASIANEYGDRLTRTEIEQYFADIEKQARQLERFVNDLLTLSRLEADVLSMEIRPEDIGAIVKEAVRVTRAAGASSTFTVSDACPGLKVMADAGRTQQVLHNLLDNASKYAPAGGAIAVAIHRGDANMVNVSIRDHGAGVRADELELIFSRLYRSNGGQSIPGSGLGLAICRAIVEAQGGTIWASLPKDGGLLVTFSLRLA